MPPIPRHENQSRKAHSESDSDGLGSIPGRRGPFPNVSMTNVLERRWLHYAFLSSDQELGMVGNITWSGPDPEIPNAPPQITSLLLLHKQGEGWRASQYNAATLMPPWSSFGDTGSYELPGRFEMAAADRTAAVELALQRTSRPSTSQSTTFADSQHFRWQSETGVKARGIWRFDDKILKEIEAVGYHERVRGCWNWSDIGGWIHGFASDRQEQEPDTAPKTSVVFTLLFPPYPPEATKASIMVWRQGRLWRHFPRRNITIVAHGELDPNLVVQVPELANLLDMPPMPSVPSRLILSAQLGSDRIIIDFSAETAARLVIPNESGIQPHRVHEVLGNCRVSGTINGIRINYETRGIVEFAGGAGGL